MNKKNVIILVIAIILAIAAVIFFVWSLNYNKTEKQNEDENIILNEESKTKDLGNTNYEEFVFYREDRSEVNLSDYKDKATMILFWNPENEDSVEDLKKVNSMYEKYKENVNFIMISTSEEVSKELKDEVSMEIFYDLYKEGQRKYNVTEVPTLIYITKDNEIFNAKTGFTTSDALEANLDIISNNI